jgi:beta-phosphoglucomutase
MFEAVIFDWDGTLADTRRVIVIAFQKALSEINCKISTEHIERRIGIGAADTFRFLLGSADIAFDDRLIKHLVERKNQVEIELTNQVKLFLGVKELLDALYCKIKMGLASMNNRSVIARLLEVNDLEKYFDAILTAESILRSKPNPEIFLKTASELKTVPEKCIIIEDSIFGVKAAKAANMSCIAVLTGVYSRQELQIGKPDLIVETLVDKRILEFVFQ